MEGDREVLLPSKSSTRSELQLAQSPEMEKVVHGYARPFDSQSGEQNSKEKN